jgi:hypothetical protein
VLGFISGYAALAATAAVGAALALLITPSHRCGACGARWNQERAKLDAPPPDPKDQIEEKCQRCSSVEIYRINYRKLKVIPLLYAPTMLIIFPIWLALPKRKCESCGLTMW